VKKINRLISRLYSIIRYFFLRFDGVYIHWTSKVHHSVEFDTGGGTIKIGRKCKIHKGVILRAHGGHIVLGANCSINPYSVIYGHYGIDFENGVHIATHGVFVPSSHQFSRKDLPIYAQGDSGFGIYVESDVWFGAGVRVLDGVRIGKGSIIGAGSVVNSSTSPYGIYSGNPIQKITTR
jgi:acetyltransferase-like isoleucine patch superfamily enzyme